MSNLHDILDQPQSAPAPAAPFAHPQPTASYVIVDPKMAASFLANNKGNRNIRRAKVDLYASQMQRGTFKTLNGESLSIDWNGKIHNGQHRLTAVVQAGVTLPMLIVRGVDPETFATVDDVSKRTAEDAFTIDGFSKREARYLPIAAALEITMRLGAKKFSTPGYIGYLTTPTETMKLVESDPSFVDTLESLKGTVKATHDLLPLGAATFLIRRMRLKEVEINRAGFTDDWIPSLFSGLNLELGPRYIIRSVIAKAAAKQESKGFSVADRMAMITKGWWSDLSNRPQRTAAGYIPPIKDATKWLELEGDDLEGLVKIRRGLKGK